MNIMPIVFVALLWVNDAEEVHSVGFADNGIG